jgi:hypothetical protein
MDNKQLSMSIKKLLKEVEIADKSVKYKAASAKAAQTKKDNELEKLATKKAAEQLGLSPKEQLAITLRGYEGPKGDEWHRLTQKILKDLLKESPFDYGWGEGVTIGPATPSGLKFYLDKELNKIAYTYKNVKGILQDSDKQDLINFLQTH